MAEANKTEKATPKKRKDQRKKGNTFQSKDAVSVAVVLVGFVLLMKLGSFIVLQLVDVYEDQLALAADTTVLTVAACGVVMRNIVITLFICTVPLLLMISLTIIITSGVQTKFLFSPELIKFKFNRIDLLQGIKRMISLRSIVQLIKSILKILVIFVLIYSSITGLLKVAPDMLSASLGNNIDYMLDTIWSMVIKICVLSVGIAVIDWAYQRYDYEKKLMMTKQEVKDEYKQTEGDPLIKGQIRQRQRKMSMNRMIQQVPGADVIVRNPTHFAIALKYDQNKDPAPIVLAKGQDLVAERIIKVAEENDILMMENPPLARSLYKETEVNGYVPTEFYGAVAEVLAWVYKQKDIKIEKRAD
ncbi:MAG: flagellar biosynthesis protein FlhB [Clostridia bacterium]|nr:flagellar biosynthesis protein FlhB [Clostridia bacterium]